MEIVNLIGAAVIAYFAFHLLFKLAGVAIKVIIFVLVLYFLANMLGMDLPPYDKQVTEVSIIRT